MLMRTVHVNTDKFSVLLGCANYLKQGKAKGSKVKFVDARMRNDTKSMKRAVKRKAGKSPSSGKRRYK
jgi:hypothetical protein